MDTRKFYGTPRGALLGIVVAFLLCAGAILSLTPPWEANDEPDHVMNVESLAGGHMYHITPYNNGNLEVIQAPLYYLALAVYQKMTGEPPQRPNLVFAPIANAQQRGNFLHNNSADGYSQRFVDLLRLPSLLLGVLTILLTYAAARCITTDRWTPVVAAAIVAGVPKFMFVSGVINNDNLSNTLGAAGLAASLTMLVRRPASLRGISFASAGLGVLAGALVLTKAPAGTLIAAMLLVLWLLAKDGREWLTMFAAFVSGGLAVCGWWLIYNQIHYGDPLALHAILVHQRATLPGAIVIPSEAQQLFVDIPKKIYSTFWYDSGWNQFAWRWYWYLPFWLLSAVGIFGLLRRSPGSTADSQLTRTILPVRTGILVCSVYALGGLASVWVVGARSQTEEGRYAFISLAAIGVLIALGYERLRVRPLLRFALPAIGLVGTLLAIHHHVLVPYRIH